MGIRGLEMGIFEVAMFLSRGFMNILHHSGVSMHAS